MEARRPLFGTNRIALMAATLAGIVSGQAAALQVKRSVRRVPLTTLSRSQREGLKSLGYVQPLGHAWRAQGPGDKGERRIGPQGQYALRLPTSRAARGKRNCSYLPHQGGREMARRART